MPEDEKHVSVSLVEGDDAEDFMLKVGDAVRDSFAGGEKPDVAFSHAMVEPGRKHYAAIIVGAGVRPNRETAAESEFETDEPDLSASSSRG